MEDTAMDRVAALPVVFRTAHAGDKNALARLLTETGLPIDGVHDHLPAFTLAFAGDVLISNLVRY